jgi:hypothetical protein
MTALDPFSILSDEVFLLIVRFMDGVELSMCNRVSRHWRNVCSDCRHWRTIFLRDFVIVAGSPLVQASIEEQMKTFTSFHGQYALYSWNWIQFLRADRHLNTQAKLRVVDSMSKTAVLHRQRAYRESVARDIMVRLAQKVHQEMSPWQMAGGIQVFLPHLQQQQQQQQQPVPHDKCTALYVLLNYWKLPFAPKYAVDLLSQEFKRLHPERK